MNEEQKYIDFESYERVAELRSHASSLISMPSSPEISAGIKRRGIIQ